MTKTIKIPQPVHKELKVYTAQNEANMTELAGYAIMEELRRRGHKFTLPKTNKSKK